jgi:hypothetical protein
MTVRLGLGMLLTLGLLVLPATKRHLSACCPAPPADRAVVNASQTVVLIWDAATQTEHFIRQASFESDADDFGFLIPTPAKPELQESGNEAFSFLRKLTEPEIRRLSRPSPGMSCGCSSAPRSSAGALPAVQVLEEKLVAGFNAVVLEASSANDLVNWLKDHGYSFSPQVEAWAKPYVEAGWKITALKVAKDNKPQDGEAKDGEGSVDKSVSASALRMSFKTDRPLFPYREPDYGHANSALGVHDRLLRIYFVGEARYAGELTQEVPWTGRVAWANPLSAEDRQRALELLKLPETTGPAEWWLTEFEDRWPYRVAPADLYFSAAFDQSPVKRPPIIQYVSSSWPTSELAFLAIAIGALPMYRRFLRSRHAVVKKLARSRHAPP